MKRGIGISYWEGLRGKKEGRVRNRKGKGEVREEGKL